MNFFPVELHGAEFVDTELALGAVVDRLPFPAGTVNGLGVDPEVRLTVRHEAALWAMDGDLLLPVPALHVNGEELLGVSHVRTLGTMDTINSSGLDGILIAIYSVFVTQVIQ